MEEALAAARSGDREALGLIWRQWNAALVRYLAARGAASADDLAADIWIEVARCLPRFAGGGDDFPKWLFTIARRRLADEYRRARHRTTVAVDGDLVAATAVEHRSPEAIVVEQDEVDRAVAMIRQLAPDQAEAVLLRVVAGLDVTEAAEVMGRTPGALRVLAHRGLRRLAEISGRGVTDGAAASIEGSR